MPCAHGIDPNVTRMRTLRRADDLAFGFDMHPLHPCAFP
jgi:hypothetical protein